MNRSSVRFRQAAPSSAVRSLGLPVGSLHGAGSIALGLGPEDAELVPLGIGEDRPTGAGAPLVAQVLYLGRSVLEQSRHLLVAGAVARHQVEVDPVLALLGVGDLDEQHPVAGPRVPDHALLVAG